MCYFGAGIVGIILALLTGFTLTEPERKTIGEETTTDGKKVSIWKVILQPRIVLLCLAASIRHCGEFFIHIISLSFIYYLKIKNDRFIIPKQKYFSKCC